MNRMVGNLGFQLWSEKYKPENIEGIVAQKKAVGEVLNFLQKWKPGKALFFYGPAGVGKTLLVEILAKQKNFVLLQLNASDTRNAESIQNLLGETSKERPLFHKGKLILMDEVDGISGQDRGAITAIINLIKNSKFPIILCANDPWQAKLRPLRNYCTLIKFTRIPTPSIRKRLREICIKEEIEIKDEALIDLARFSEGDLRSAINDLQLVASGKKIILLQDLEALGYRERGLSIFDILPTIFNSRSINAAKKVINSSDKDPEEIFWWVENNLAAVFKNSEAIAKGYDLLSKADCFRAKVIKQQNFRFKRYMIDLLASISLFKPEIHGWVPYKPPLKLIQLGATKQRRAILNELYKKIGSKLHCSSKVVRREYLPYFKIILKKKPKIIESLELNKKELELIKS